MVEQNKLFKLFIKNGIRLVLELVAYVVGVFIKPMRSADFSIDDQILLRPATELAECIREGKLTSERIVRAYINQAKQVNKSINSIVEEHYGRALERACEIDREIATIQDSNNKHKLSLLAKTRPLLGVPVSIKETIALEGASYTGGVAARAGKRARASNEAVKQLIDSGLIPLASTNTPCLNMWFDCHNLLHGRTSNPYDRSRIPGGSSGGEAALIAAAGSLVGVGTDMAGSIRIPSNFCGIFGHKPTPFVVATNGLFTPGQGERGWLRGIGPMTRYSCDLMPMLKLMVKNEAQDKLRLDEPVDLHKVKIFYCEDLGDPLTSACDSDVRSALRAAVQHLVSKFGNSAFKLELDGFRYGLPLWSAIANSEETPPPINSDMEVYIKMNPLYELVRCLFGTSMFTFTAIFNEIIQTFGAKRGSSKQLYLKRAAEKLRQEFNSKLGQDGVLLMPTYPQAAPHHWTSLFKFLSCSYTAVPNTLYAPITQCPLGMSREGLPIGVQLIATQYNDRLTLALARELDQAFGGWIPPVKTMASNDELSPCLGG